MREIEVKKWCDWHDSAESEKVEATVERTISIDKSPFRMLDLCASCDSELMSVLLTLIEDAPFVEKPRITKRGKTVVDIEAVTNRTCPDCAHLCPTRSALGAHVKNRHGKKLTDYTWVS